MANYQIKWNKGDFIKLGKAIAEFNRQVNKLEKEERNLHLPDLQDYQTKKNEIVTRKELNRYIKALNRFSKDSQQQTIELDSEKVTKWEYTELKKARERIRTNISTQIEELQKPIAGTKYSRIQMGSVEYRQLQAELKRLDKLEKKKGYDFKILSESILRRGSSDYIFRKQIIYKQNFMKMLDEFKNYKGYEEFKNTIKDLPPEDFYRFISVQKDLTDIQYYYDVKSGKVVPSRNEF